MVADRSRFEGARHPRRTLEDGLPPEFEVDAFLDGFGHTDLRTLLGDRWSSTPEEPPDRGQSL